MKLDLYRLHSLPIAILLVVVFFILTPNALGQNLVPNGSFEEFYECPNAIGQVDRCIGWSSWANSPDYFNRCVQGLSFDDSLVDVPLNGLGFQEASDGNGYMGLLAIDPPNPPMDGYREIIGCELTENLVPGTTYYLQLKAVRAGDGFYYELFNMACDHLGFHFTNQSFDWDSSPVPIENQAQWHAETLITDSTTWTTLSGTFTADAAYSHLGIGNFYTNSNTNFQYTGSKEPNLGAYYFIDEVIVSTEPFIEQYEIEQEENPLITVLPRNEIKIEFPGRFYLEIISIGGDEVLHSSYIDSIILDSSCWASNIYFIRISSGQDVKINKIFIP